MSEEEIDELIEYNLEYFNEAITDEQIKNSMLDKAELEAKLQEKDKEIINLNNTIINLHSIICKKQNNINRLNNIINELEKYINNELILDFYNDKMPCELIINKMENMIKKLKERDNKIE